MDEKPDLVCEFCVKLGIEVEVESQATHIELHLNAERDDNSTNASQAQMHNLCFPNEESKVVCDDCDMEFSSKSVLEDHINSEHFKSKPKKVISSNAKSCGSCGKRFKWKYDRIQHEKAVHLKLKPFNCRFCQRSFGKNTDRILHENGVHKKLKVSCTICEAKFTDNRNRMKHERTVHMKEKKFSCGICHKKFSQNSGRIVHENGVHKKLKVSCTICGAKFTTNSSRIKHERTVHSNEKKVHPPSSSQNKKSAKFLLHGQESPFPSDEEAEYPESAESIISYFQAVWTAQYVYGIFQEMSDYAVFNIYFVTCIAFLPQDDRYFPSGSLDAKLRLWDIPDKKVAIWNEMEGGRLMLTFVKNGKFAVVGTFDGRCIFYSME